MHALLLAGQAGRAAELAWSPTPIRGRGPSRPGSWRRRAETGRGPGGCSNWPGVTGNRRSRDPSRPRWPAFSVRRTSPPKGICGRSGRRGPGRASSAWWRCSPSGEETGSRFPVARPGGGLRLGPRSPDRPGRRAVVERRRRRRALADLRGASERGGRRAAVVSPRCARGVGRRARSWRGNLDGSFTVAAQAMVHAARGDLGVARALLSGWGTSAVWRGSSSTARRRSPIRSEGRTPVCPCPAPAVRAGRRSRRGSCRPRAEAGRGGVRKFVRRRCAPRTLRAGAGRVSPSALICAGRERRTEAAASSARRPVTGSGGWGLCRSWNGPRKSWPPAGGRTTR